MIWKIIHCPTNIRKHWGKKRTILSPSYSLYYYFKNTEA